MEMDSYESGHKDQSVSQANIILRKKTYGGVPPGAGMREDVILLFEELEEARNTLGQIQGVITDLPDPRASIGQWLLLWDLYLFSKCKPGFPDQSPVSHLAFVVTLNKDLIFLLSWILHDLVTQNQGQSGGEGFRVLCTLSTDHSPH